MFENLMAIRQVKSICLILLLFLLGYWLAQQQDVKRQTHWYGHHLKHSQYCTVRIVQEPEEKTNTWKLWVEVVAMFPNRNILTTQGEAILYISKKPPLPNIEIGQQMVIRNKFEAIQNSGNPGAFKYANYCHRIGVYHSAFLKPGDIHLDTTQLVTPPFTIQASRWVRAVINKYIPSSSANGIAHALLIGYRKNLDKDLLQAYSNTGLMHLIAISGMHIGILYFSLLSILQALPFIRNYEILTIATALISLWLFAFIIGFPPSVARSVFMFTCIGLGNLVNRKIHIYNNLAFSGFMLLWIKPYWLFDIGFQLSYAAVFSLAVFYKPIYKKIYVKYWLLDKIWQLLAATLSAQIFTMPLVLYYFHQFPTLFLLNNLLAVALTTFIIYAEIVLIFLSGWDQVAKYLGEMITHTINFLNHMVMELSSWSSANITGCKIAIWELILLLAVVGCMAYYFFYRQLNYFLYALFGIWVVIIHQQFEHYAASKQKTLVVFNVYKGSEWALVQGKTMFLPKNKQKEDSNKLDHSVIKSACDYYRATQIAKLPHKLLSSFEIFQVEEKVVVKILDNNYQGIHPKIQVDKIILSDIQYMDWHKLNQTFTTSKIILDSSIPKWKASQFIRQAKSFGFNIFAVSLQGAYTESM